MNKRIFALTTILASAVASSAFAQDRFEPTLGEQAQIRNCFGEHLGTGPDVKKCIGLIADDCLSGPEGNRTSGMVGCATREAKVWDALLNEQYKKARENLSPNVFAKLRDVQRLWIQYRDEKCAFPFAQYEGGTIAQPMAAYCQLEMTAERTIELREIAQVF